jgi:hypothetical protein
MHGKNSKRRLVAAVLAVAALGVTAPAASLSGGTVSAECAGNGGSGGCMV